MVIVLEGSERRQQAKFFEQLFRLRYELFVKRRGWALPSLHGREVDQYDLDDAVYFLDIDDEDSIQGSVRINPSESGSLIADYFPHLIETGGSVRSPNIYEATRLICLPPDKSRQGVRAAKARLLGAMVEWGLRQKLSFIQTVIETPALSGFVEMTAMTIPLGLSHPYGGGKKTPGGGDCMAIRWPVTEQVLEDIRLYGSLSDVGPDWFELADSARQPALSTMH
jgi:acyl-homoserine lactone synthase